MNMLKRIVCCIIIMSVLVGVCGVTAFAEGTGEVNDNIIADCAEDTDINIMSYSTGKATLTISGTTATCTSIVKGDTSTTKIIIYMYLQRYINGSWSNYKSWDSTTYASSATLTKTASSLPKGYSYRVLASVYGYGGETKTGLHYSATISI